ncbi:carbon storage regulator [Pseudomonas sp. BRM28]|nr:carbon storage regulator [Pseudomonas sp. BRM28]
MLILSRRTGETIRINDDIIVTVVSISGMQARLGIEAPAGVAIHRQEIYDKIQAQGDARPARPARDTVSIDPVDLFIKLNPADLPEEYMTKGRGSFVDVSTRARYEMFLAGYQAAQGGRHADA